MNKLETIIKIVIVTLFFAGFIMLWSGGCTTWKWGTSKPDTPSISVPITPANSMWQAVKSSNWLITASIVGIAISVFALMNGFKLGFAGLVSCCVSLFATLAVVRFATWMAVCGLVGAVLLCTASILVRSKAIRELISGTQQLKRQVDSKDMANKVLKEHQSKSTQSIVQQVKGKLKLKGIL